MIGRSSRPFGNHWPSVGVVAKSLGRSTNISNLATVKIHVHVL